MCNLLVRQGAVLAELILLQTAHAKKYIIGLTIVTRRVQILTRVHAKFTLHVYTPCTRVHVPTLSYK